MQRYRGGDRCAPGLEAGGPDRATVPRKDLGRALGAPPLRKCEPTHASKLQLASILASAGQCDEAGTLLSEVSAQTSDTLYREVRGVLHAKAGQADQAMALFDTLPGRAENYHPAGIVLTTAQEMIEQCHAARTLALVVKLAEAYPEHLLVRSLNLQCHLLAGDFDKARELAQVPDFGPQARVGLRTARIRRGGRGFIGAARLDERGVRFRAGGHPKRPDALGPLCTRRQCRQSDLP